MDTHGIATQPTDSHDRVATKLAVVFMLCSAAAAADAGQVLSAIGGKCSVTIPADWTVNGPLGLSPDKGVSIAVSQPKGIESLRALKESVRTLYKTARITRDSPNELELEGKAVDGTPNVYRAIASASGVCIAEARYRAGRVDEARKLVHTLAATR